MTHLFTPLKLRATTLKNRIGVSPMCMYSCREGFATDWHLVHLGSRAVGGAGLVMAEATAVEPRGRISPGDLGIWSDDHIDPLSRITRFIEEHGSVPSIQLAHAGRKASMPVSWDADSHEDWPTVGPSAIAYSDQYQVPTELSVGEIHGIIQNFADATRRSVEAGFRVIELHAAHGYLAHSFLSPISNQRNDDYGGSFHNRSRFTLETARAMRLAMPDDLALAVRLSCSDWIEGGWTIEESVELSKELKILGVDLIDCSSGGGVAKAKVLVGPGYQVPFADAIRKNAHVATAAVGLITNAHQAEEILERGQADLIFMAREFLRDPYWPLHAAIELGETPMPPIQYGRGFM